MRPKCTTGIAALLATVFCGSSAFAQVNRITQTIDNSQRTVLAGHLHPKALAAQDAGRVAPSLELSYITLVLAPSPAQQADLVKLLASQQTPGSPDYHRWLTPEEYGQRFGVSDSDLSKISQWLEGQGLKILSVARGRNAIAVSGSAAQVETAFQTEIHDYASNGETHFANASEPSVPAALAGVVRSIRGLNDFRMQPRPAGRLKPAYTEARGTHYIAPGDLWTIYDFTPLYNAGINGTGQKLAIAGQVTLNMSDITEFRNSFGLPANLPTTLLVPGSRNPGSDSSDLAESDLDLEWSGAAAPNTSITFVYSTDVMTSVEYAIDNAIAPVVSVSYGECEPEAPSSDVSAFEEWAQQAGAEGITWFAASGDNGAADCADSQNPGLAVDLPGSLPEVTSVGGTEFVEGSGTYWGTTNGSNGGSALSYIPETTWNDSAEDGTPSASGGGTSILFAKPSWQTGTGVPSDNARHVPDVALSASADHDGYLVYSGGQLQVYGGTSVPTPTFAGLTTLINQARGGGGLGNVNPTLYSLAQAGWSSGMFHDITTGNNIVTVAAQCTRSNPNCTAGSAVGYYAGVGYDQTTGLGSVDAYKLVQGWSGVTITAPAPRATVTLLTNLTTVGTGQTDYLIATVTSSDGTTPAGTVSFAIGATSLGTATLTGSAGTATATLIINGSELPLGTGEITATYESTNTASVTVSVSGSGSTTGGVPSISAVTNGASFQQGFAPGAVLSIFGSQLATSTATASSVPLPISTSGVAVLVNGEAAPLYYVSPTQINVQIPYETTPNSTATLSVNNNGQVTTQSFQVAAASPAIFTNTAGAVVPSSTAAVGNEVAFYITGAGAVSPAIATGAAPAAGTANSSLPVPSQAYSMTIGGQPATIDFIGIPVGLVGVVQINATVPSGLAAGAQPVVVTVGTVKSPAATLTVTN